MISCVISITVAAYNRERKAETAMVEHFFLLVFFIYIYTSVCIYVRMYVGIIII